MAAFHEVLGNEEMADRFRAYAEAFEDALEAVFWNDQEGSWFDYDVEDNKQRTAFYPSNMAPLWADCFR
jgi:alpha,alpha-trehalase